MPSPAYTAISLTPGVTYDVAVQSRNSYVYSASSDILTLLCAWKPEVPAAPSTYIVNDLCYINWDEPFTNGWPITGYQIYVRDHDGTFIRESVECDGTTSDVITNSECAISLFSLIEAPFNLV